MGALEDRVVVVTGAGRGIGREHALLAAREGARVVVNDVNAELAQAVVDEIAGIGGKALAHSEDVGTWRGAESLIEAAVDGLGGLHGLVNNAGILRDVSLLKMTEQQWDDVMRVNLKGHFLCTRHAGTYWRAQAKQGASVAASVVHTSSRSGLYGNRGQANYAASKLGVVALNQTCQVELGGYGVRCNVVVPTARTSLTVDTPRLADGSGQSAAFDELDPQNIAPFVAFLLTEDCPIAGRVFFVRGGTVQLFQPWTVAAQIDCDHTWTIDELRQSARGLADVELVTWNE